MPHVSRYHSGSLKVRAAFRFNISNFHTAFRNKNRRRKPATRHADQIPDPGKISSIVVIGAREPVHKHAELRHGASNLVVLK